MLRVRGMPFASSFCKPLIFCLPREQAWWACVTWARTTRVETRGTCTGGRRSSLKPIKFRYFLTLPHT